MNTPLSIIVLAAGKGTRMKSSMAKVLHHVFYKPMICHVLDTLTELQPKKIVAVTGHQYQQVESTLEKYDLSFAHQTEQLGTGHAVLAAGELLAKESGVILIVCGDTPLVRPETLRDMVDSHLEAGNDLTVMSTIMDNPANYGRIITNDAGHVEKIVEEKDATDLQRKVQEVNAGIYCVDHLFLFEALKQVGTDNKQGEVYLTDIVEIARESNLVVGRYICADYYEITGVNSRVELAAATKIKQQRRNHDLMMSGVSMIDSDSSFVEDTVIIGHDTVLHPNCQLLGDTVIGCDCVIESFSKLVNCQVGDGVTVKSFTNMVDGNIDAPVKSRATLLDG